jgi:hypothetical protein
MPIRVSSVAPKFHDQHLLETGQIRIEPLMTEGGVKIKENN